MHENEHFLAETTAAETVQTDCSNCDSSGVVLDEHFETEDCAVCDGTGTTTKRRSARVINLPIFGTRDLAA